MIRWSATALRQLEQIDDTIRADNPAAAVRQLRAIFQAVDRLALFPRSGRAAATDMERLIPVPQTPYIVYYRVADEAIFIRSVWHGARLPPRLR